MQNLRYDIAIIGGGIVSMATAMALTQRTRASLVVLEAEKHLAAHQTGHNSGVIHSGIYYRPGSLKARHCVQGREAMYRFCDENGVTHERCGKIVVATCEDDLPILTELEHRGQANGLQSLRRLCAEEIREYEPHVVGVAGLYVGETGIVDYVAVTEKMAQITCDAGGMVRTGARVLHVHRRAQELVLETTGGEFHCHNIINCGGLQCDRVARMCGVKPDVQIVPFRGEYYELVPERRTLVRNLVYPVPDPRFPFLGVHFTRTISGRVEAGPNAVLAFKREGYSRTSLSLRDILSLATYGGFFRMASRYWRMGMSEFYRSWSRSAFVASLQKLVPEVRTRDIRPAGAGVRAQAVEPDGTLVNDFRIVEAERMVHVLNAPSPAATASVSIGKTIADMAMKNFGLA